MTKELSTQADIPTHKLTLRISEDRYKTFYVTELQAERLAKGINGSDQFISLSKDVDPDAPSYYPKYGSRLERLTKAEMKARQERYDRVVETYVEEKQEEKKKFESEKVDAWINENPEAWEQKKQESFVKMKSTPMFSSASDVVQSVLVRMEARRMVHAQIIKPTP